MGCHLMMLLLLIILLFNGNKNHTVVSIDVKEPFILGECDGGLGNRLRVIASYIVFAETLHNNSLLYFIWQNNTDCPAHYDDLFLPIDRVHIINSTNDIEELSKHPLLLEKFHNNRGNFDYNMGLKGIPKRHWKWYKRHTYGMINPVPSVMNKAKAFLDHHDLCKNSFLAMHVRRTDFMGGMQLWNYWKFTNDSLPGQKVLLMADNPVAQNYLLNEFNTNGVDKIIVVEKMKLLDNETLSALPKAYRHTSVETALVEVVIAVYSSKFLDTGGSSFSELVKALWGRKIDWALCPHTSFT